MFHLERATTSSIVMGNIMTGALPPQSPADCRQGLLKTHIWSFIITGGLMGSPVFGCILLGIKISVLLPHLGDEEPSLKSPPEGWWYPRAPTVLPALLVSGIDGAIHGERLQKCESRGLCTLSLATLQDLSLCLLQLLPGGSKYHLCLL